MKINSLVHLQLFVIFLFLLASCSKGQEGRGTRFETIPYYDLAGMISRQINLLDSLNPKVDQTGLVNGEKEQEIARMDSSSWEQALYLFKEADINKPVLQDSYTIKDSTLRTGERVKIYRAKQKSLPVRNIKVFYQDSLQNPTAITIDYEEVTYLHYNHRQLKMEFLLKDNKSVLSKYSVQGKQKMILQDTIYFENSGKVIFN